MQLLSRCNRYQMSRWSTNDQDRERTSNGWVFVSLSIEGGVTSRINTASAKAQRSSRSESSCLPPGHSLAWSGQYEYMEREGIRLVSLCQSAP